MLSMPKMPKKQDRPLSRRPKPMKYPQVQARCDQWYRDELWDQIEKRGFKSEGDGITQALRLYLALDLPSELIETIHAKRATKAESLARQIAAIVSKW